MCIKRVLSMLTQLRMELKTEGKLTVYQSSNLHGVIMERIDTNYAEILHESGLNPYSQHLEYNDNLEWVVCTYTKEAYERIIIPLLNENFNGFELTGRDIKVEISNKKLTQVPQKELMKKFYEENSDRYITIEFLTPSSFKSNGEYLIFPDLELMFKSLMNKYSSATNMDMLDEDALGELVTNCKIVRYNLRSCFFPLEKVKIQAFRGWITVRMSGTQTLANYANMLLRFGEYSGIGIKCSIGMGAIKIKERTRVDSK